MLVSFLPLWQNTWKNQLKRGKVNFWLMVAEFSVHDPLVPTGSMVKQNSMARSTWWRKTAQLSAVKKQRGAWERAGQKNTFKGSDLLPPTRHHLVKFLPLSSSPFSYQSISVLVHWWNQSPHGPVIFQWSHPWTLLHWGPSFQHMNFWGIVQFQTITPHFLYIVVKYLDFSDWGSGCTAEG
jgi:hypothetical protein